MNQEGWVAGLVTGSAFALVVEVSARSALAWYKKRGRAAAPRCRHCDAFLNDDGTRAEFPVECLKVCAVCGDTWPASVVDRTIQAQEHGRGTTVPALRAVAVEVCTCSHHKSLEGAACSECEEVVSPPPKPQGPAVRLLKEGQVPEKP